MRPFPGMVWTFLIANMVQHHTGVTKEVLQVFPMNFSISKPICTINGQDKFHCHI